MVKFLAQRYFHACLIGFALFLNVLFLPLLDAGENNLHSYRIHIDQGHPWRPPFGLKRVGSPMMAWIEQMAPAETPKIELWLSSQVAGRETERKKVEFAKGATRSVRIMIGDNVEQVLLLQTSDDQSQATELAEKNIHRKELEADAVAKATVVTNPVDLGVIFPPSNELLLGPGQSAQVDVAVLSRADKKRTVNLAIWFDSNPASKQRRKIVLNPGQRYELSFEKLKGPAKGKRTILNVAIMGEEGGALWQKKIPVILVQQLPSWPRFGATQTILRYDSPISVRDPETGEFSEIAYQDAWKPELQDVVVSLPTGARFVFWRGASYIPFWIGTHNTGLCYEWAERLPPRPKNAVDCVEPLMDKELRHGRIKIVESTPSRVHVRWTYQSTDLLYNIWGDSAVEDYYFYPDGFGTRVVNLKRDPNSQYELSEFIILTAAGTYPLNVLPRNTIDAIFLDGKKREFKFPGNSSPKTKSLTTRNQSAIYRVRIHKQETACAIYFSPHETAFPSVVFNPFFDEGELVTPAYWGSHWPLARGNATGNKIDERVHITPCHNSLMSWADKRPRPLSSGIVRTVDSLGQSREMIMERWAWLIGMTDADDARLVQWAQSYANPPSLEVTGASIELNAYAIQRRAIRLKIDQPIVSVTIKPTGICINPVFELLNAPEKLLHVTLDNKTIGQRRYAWDGHTFWLQADIDSPAKLALKFQTK